MKIWWLTSVLAWLSATGYAGLDEFHQMLTGDRTPSFQDVMLDSMGGIDSDCLMLDRWFCEKKILGRSIN